MSVPVEFTVFYYYVFAMGFRGYHPLKKKLLFLFT